MNHAYLIMAHNEPELLRRLVCALDDYNNDIFIHWDKKSKITIDMLGLLTTKSKLYFIERRNCYWGGYSQINCEIQLLKKAISEKNYDYYHLITGADLPIKPISEIHKYFEENSGKEFIGYDNVANKSKNFLNRIDGYYFRFNILGRNIMDKFGIGKLLSRVICVIKGKRRIDDMIYMKGSVYFSITDALARYVVRNEKEIKKRYSFTRCADEIFLQTLAYNSSFCKNVTGYGQHYIDWSRHGSSPPIIDEGYYEILKNSNKMFARKFSYERYPKIVEQVLNELVKTKSGADKAAIR